MSTRTHDALDQGQEEILAYDPIEAVRMSRLITGIVETQLVYVAARIRLADRLASGSRSAGALAEETGLDAARLMRVLRALSSLGVIREVRSGEFALTSLGYILRSDIGQSQRDLAIMMGSPWHVASWGNILRSVEANVSSFEAVHVETVFQYLEGRPDERSDFGRAMAFTSRRHAEAILSAYDFGSFVKVADIGGGQGQLLAEILAQNERLRGVLLDLPGVADDAAEALRGAGFASRLEVLAGSFFEAVPPNADLYVLKYIIHDWDDERAALILRNCRAAMNSDARLLIIDAVLPETNPPFAKAWPDIEMMVVLPNGRERTRGEFERLLSGAGLMITRIIATRSELSIIEAAVAVR